MIAGLTLVAVLASGQRGNFGIRLGEAPGLTLDEGFNVAMGVYLVRTLEQDGLASLHPATIREVYGSDNYNPDHPPLGRWALGFMHEFLGAPPDVPFSDAAARPASAVAFALTILLIGWFIQRWYGPFAGTISALAVALLPRQFAHAHLASLETFVGLTYAACVLVTADRCRPEVAPRAVRSFVVAGVFFGLALLTKMQAVFLAPAIGLWALTQWRLRSVWLMAVFGAVGLAVFFVGWPWLWLDPLSNLKEYFARSTERQTLYCFYAGERWEDRLVPWHFPWVMFLVSTPLPVHFLAAWGTTHSSPRAFRVDSRVQLILWSIAIPLLVFSLPGIRVYDGERLFGNVFPLWAGLTGIGADSLRRRFSSREGLVSAAIVLLFLLPAWSIVSLNPFQMSYYNLLTGGLGGADRLGFERSYWMEGLTDTFQDEIVKQVPRGSVIDVAPVLHPVYLPHLLSQSTALRRHDLRLKAYDDKQPDGSRYVLQFHRKADPWASLDPPPEGSRVLAEATRSGVPMVTLYELPLSD